MNYLAKLKQCSIPVISMYLLTCLFMLTGVISFNQNLFIAFTIGSFMLIIGQALFLIGAESSLITMGKRIGGNLAKLKKLWLILLVAFIFTFCTTIAEPDVSLYIQKILSLNSNLSALLLIFAFGLGVGSFAVLGIYRIVKDIPYKIIIGILFIIIIILMIFNNNTFLGIAFDGAGITSGPITAPFLLALTVGISNIRINDSNENSFGLIAISSIGSTIVLLILGLFLNTGESSQVLVKEVSFFGELLKNMKDVAIILVPISLFFFLLQRKIIGLSKLALQKIIAGLFITFFGLVIFLTGITYGFSNMGYFIGSELGAFLSSTNNYFVVILFAFILGFILIFTEPSLKMFAKEVETVTSGNLKSNVVLFTVGIGVAISVVLSILIIVFDIALWLVLLPILALILILSFILPQMLTTISFDSGGLACGTIVPSFLVPICIGLGLTFGSHNIFGLAGIITFLPILVFQILGLIYVYMQKVNERKERKLYKNLSRLIEKNLNINKKNKNASLSAKVFKKEKKSGN